MQTKQQTVSTIAKNATVRMQQRIAAVVAQRAAKNAVRKQNAAQQAYMLGVAQLAAQYGFAAPTLFGAPKARANSATVVPSASSVVFNGVAYKPTKAVHAIAQANPSATRAEVLALCKTHGINGATASTQYGVYKAALKAQQAAAQ